MKKISELLLWGENELRNKTEESFLSSQILLCHILQIDRSKLYIDNNEQVSASSKKKYEELIKKRKNGHPISYLTGSRSFWTLDLIVDTNTLIPRPETEHLIEVALELNLPKKTTKVLDLGTGCGAIAIALAQERSNWQFFASDLSKDALEVAKKNIKKYNLDNILICQSNWFDKINQKFDLILSNPPYIAANDPHLFQGDLCFEPRTALCSGKNGFEAIKIIISNSPHYLKSNGWLFFEHGYNQKETAEKMLKEKGFINIKSVRDLSGKDRVIGGQYIN